MVKTRLLPRCEPWCWKIYLHLPQKWPSFVGKYSSSMVRIWEARYKPFSRDSKSNCRAHRRRVEQALQDIKKGQQEQHMEQQLFNQHQSEAKQRESENYLESGLQVFLARVGHIIRKCPDKTLQIFQQQHGRDQAVGRDVAGTLTNNTSRESLCLSCFYVKNRSQPPRQRRSNPSPSSKDLVSRPPIHCNHPTIYLLGMEWSYQPGRKSIPP